MEKSSSTDYTLTPQQPAFAPEPDPAPKRFGLMSALVRFAVAIAVLAVVGFQIWTWINDRPEPPARMNLERTFTVAVIEPVYGTFSADISTFGQVTAPRTIDLRTQVQGRVIEVSPDFAVGNQVQAGDVLLRVDPFAYDGAVIEAQAGLVNAELSLSEAREAYGLEERNIETARLALAAAETDLERARSLLSGGSITQQTVESRELAVNERRQTLSQREANLFTLNAQFQRQTAAIEQARHGIETAQRNRANTEITAPFTGVITAQTASVGGYVNSNEVIGGIYESATLDVNFTISDRQFGQLSAVGLPGRAVTVTWALDPEPVVVSGTVSRAAAQVDAATGGVELFAKLDADEAALLRPGTFVSVTVEGIAYENALRVPETTVYDDDHLYVIRQGRMAAVPLTILARDNAHLIVSATIPEGERIITSRLSQAGEGVAVRVEGEELQMQPGGPGGPAGQPRPGAGAPMMRGPGG